VILGKNFRLATGCNLELELSIAGSRIRLHGLVGLAVRALLVPFFEDLREILIVIGRDRFVF